MGSGLPGAVRGRNETGQTLNGCALQFASDSAAKAEHENEIERNS